VLAAVVLATLPLGHGAELRWTQGDGAAACIGHRSLADAVTARVGRASVTGEPLHIDGEIDAVEGGWRATIVTRDRDGHELGRRELRETSSDCHALDDKLVLVIALTVAPALLEVQAEPPLVVRAPSDVPAAVTHAQPTERRVQMALGLLTVHGLGGRNPVAATATVRLGVPRTWPVEISGGWMPFAWSLESSQVGDFSVAFGRLAMCPTIYRFVSGCVGAQAGRLHAWGLGPSANEHDDELLLDLTGELRAELRLGQRVSVRLAVGVWLAGTRQPIAVFLPGQTASSSEVSVAGRF
jgi:hypothetical protein